MLQFWKMHGLGNDFIMIDDRDGKIGNKEAVQLARKLCKRRLAVGADGLLLLSNSSTADSRMRIFNADGSEAEMCGNGIRCLAKYCYEKGIIRKTEFTVETLAGSKQVWLTVKDQLVPEVKVDMGMPEWERSKIPMIGEGMCIDADLRVDNENYKITCLSLGNPHCVIFVENVDAFPVQFVGPKIESLRTFPRRTNVEFVQLLRKDELKVRVWERGCGETLACGTGACAAAVAANRLGKVGSRVSVNLAGGELQIEITEHVLMTGPAEKVFEGELF
ncbi:MAG TPA: diaminopimelate epimerase, partial [Candidatus Bathyarchaeia archaeon]